MGRPSRRVTASPERRFVLLCIFFAVTGAVRESLQQGAQAIEKQIHQSHKRTAHRMFFGESMPEKQDAKPQHHRHKLHPVMFEENLLDKFLRNMVGEGLRSDRQDGTKTREDAELPSLKRPDKNADCCCITQAGVTDAIPICVELRKWVKGYPGAPNDYQFLRTAKILFSSQLPTCAGTKHSSTSLGIDVRFGHTQVERLMCGPKYHDLCPIVESELDHYSHMILLKLEAGAIDGAEVPGMLETLRLAIVTSSANKGCWVDMEVHEKHKQALQDLVLRLNPCIDSKASSTYVFLHGDLRRMPSEGRLLRSQAVGEILQCHAALAAKVEEEEEPEKWAEHEKAEAKTKSKDGRGKKKKSKREMMESMKGAGSVDKEEMWEAEAVQVPPGGGDLIVWEEEEEEEAEGEEQREMEVGTIVPPPPGFE